MRELFEQDVVPKTTWNDMVDAMEGVKAGQILLKPRIIDGETENTQSQSVTFTFYEHTVSQSAGMGIPKTIVVDRDCTIDKVYIHLETAPGSAKTLTVDVNKNGTTIFTTQSKRPSITGTATVDESDTPDVVVLAKNDLLEMDIDVSDGAADKLSVYVRCK